MVGGQALAHALDEIGVALDAGDVAGQGGQASGDEAGAGADLQHFVAGLEVHRLQHAALDHGLHHHLAVLERQRQVGEGELAVAQRHEVLAAHRHQGVEHARV